MFKSKLEALRGFRVGVEVEVDTYLTLAVTIALGTRLSASLPKLIHMYMHGSAM